MQTTQTQSRRVSEYEDPYETNRSGLDHDVPHWEPDWWSRMMAIGSMLVAAAALWHARYPNTMTASTDTVASVVGAAQPDGKNVNDTASEPTGENSNPDEDSQPTDAVSTPDVSGLKHAAANATEEPPSVDGKKTTVMKADLSEPLEEPDTTQATEALKAFVSPKVKPETDLEKVPSASDAEDTDTESGEKVAADKAPQITNKPLMIDGFTDVDIKDGLAIVDVASRPLATEYAVTLTVRNNSDDLAVVSRVVFTPNQIVEDVSTDLATRPFGVSTTNEFVLAFAGADNQAKDKSDQGRYVRLLSDTFNVPSKSTVDLRLAIENEEHIGFGLVGKLTLEYNTSESLDIENVSVAFIGKQ